MIVDSSALVAILLEEPESETYAATILSSEEPRISAANWLEATMVFDGRAGPESHARLDRVITEMRIAITPFDVYGRNSKSGARWNIGDCMAYALAKQTGEPLLFKGNDFPHTDIPSALS